MCGVTSQAPLGMWRFLLESRRGHWLQDMGRGLLSMSFICPPWDQLCPADGTDCRGSPKRAAPGPSVPAGTRQHGLGRDTGHRGPSVEQRLRLQGAHWVLLGDPRDCTVTHQPARNPDRPEGLHQLDAWWPRGYQA